MSLATASKQQLKTWKMAAASDEGRITEHVLLEITKLDKEYAACLIATDGYCIVKRSIDTEAQAKKIRISIPRKTMQSAERSMGKKDRAYFEEGRIVIRAATLENPIVDFDSPIKAIIPYTEQTVMDFPETRPLLERSANSPFPEKVMKIDGKLLKDMLGQFKDTFSVELHIAGADEVLLIKSEDVVDGNKIIGGLMPQR